MIAPLPSPRKPRRTVAKKATKVAVKKNAWAQAIQKARKTLNMEGFVPVGDTLLAA
jgi:hypothetical protein